MSKKRNVFVEGAISPEFIARSISNHQTKTEIGAHEIFLGQVRADKHGNETVNAIEYTCYTEMAEESIASIREKAFEKFELSCLHIYHSIGMVKAGEICFFVFASSPHRKDARNAVVFLVDTIKSETPIFGKEFLTDSSHIWKKNIADK